MVSQSIPRTRTGDGSPALVAGQLLAGQLVVIGCAVAVNVLSARAMGPAGRGHLALLLQIGYAAATLTILGVDRAYAATVVPAAPKPRRAVMDLARLTTPPTAVVTVVLLLAAQAAGASWPAAAGMAGVAAGVTATLVLRTAAAASSRGALYLAPVTAFQLVLVATAGVLFWSGTGSVDAWLWAYAAAFLALPVVAWMLLHNTARSRRTRLRPLRRAGLHVLPGSVASAVMMRSDRLLLPVLGSFEQAGWYAVTATLTEAIVWPVASYVDSHIPQWRIASQAGTLRTGPVLAASAAYGAAAACTVTAVGWLMIVPVFGAAFQPSLPLLAPLSAAAGIYGVSRVAIGLDLAGGRLSTAMYTDVPAVVVSVAAYLTLIPHYGAMGAAWGSVAGYTTAAAVSVTLALQRKSQR